MIYLLPFCFIPGINTVLLEKIPTFFIFLYTHFSYSAIMEYIRKLHERHERLKHYVHNRFRYPLPPWGQKVMACVYFSIPVLGGYYLTQWAISKSHKSIGPNGELLSNKKIEGIGDKRVLDNGELQDIKDILVGVKLVNSDETTQEINKKNLELFLKQERKKRIKKVDELT
jgi:hypothetical protein